MQFQHVLPTNIEGATLFGLTIESLHSATIDGNALRQWTSAFANSVTTIDDVPGNSQGVSFRDGFLSELQAYCLYVASFDGSITDEVLDGISWLIDKPRINFNQAIGILKTISTSGWLDRYPTTFQTLVRSAAGDDKNIISAGEIYYYYHQIARFVYSIGHADDFDEQSGAREYVNSFRMYVERVSEIGFEFPPETERTIDDVCRQWDRLMKAEHDALTEETCGTWLGISGVALSNSGLSGFVLAENGQGHVTSAGTTEQSGSGVLWEVVMLPGSSAQAPVVHIPQMKTSVVLQPLDSRRMSATVYSEDQSVNLKSAIYQREQPDVQQIAPTPVKSPKNATSSGVAPTTANPTDATPDASCAADGETNKPKKKVPWALIAAAVVIALGVVIYNTVIKPANDYDTATDYYESGLYQMAANAFEELGDYKDSDSMRQKALLGVAAVEAEEEAESSEDPEAWEAAAEAYEQLSEGRGESEAHTCRNYAAYYKGKKLMSKGSWKKARKALEDIDDKGFEDVASLLDECDTQLAYAEAEDLLAKGDYYGAYVKFKALEGKSGDGLPDFSERAQACIQEMPGTGALYTNPDFASAEVPLAIKNSFGNTYYKIYAGDTLVMTIFIRPNETANVTLPAGTYRMNEAHGDQWFGEEDMFGASGRYYRCVFGEEDTATLEPGYSYEISASDTPDPGSTGIENEEIDMESF